MAFPASLPSFTNPTGTDELDDLIGGLTHSGQHAALNDAVEEIAGALTAGSLTVTSWTPTFNNAYGTIPTVGAGGSSAGWYVTFGALFVCSFRIVFGSGCTAGTGIYSLNPPVASYGTNAIGGHGAGSCTNGSGQTLAANFEMYNNLINGIVSNATNVLIGAGTPTGMGSATNTPAFNATMICRRA